MKKAIVITIIVAFVVGVSGGVWLKTRLDAQAAAGVAQEQAESKYDVGPPDAQEMLELVNQERAKVGVAPLRLDERLNASAQEKADDMQNRGYYDHKSPDSIEGYSLVFKHMQNRCRYASENLAKVSTADGKIGNSRFTIDNWMRSTKGHREAILDAKYSLVGFGISKQGYDLIVVQHFCELK
nr:MAG TPA: hypothetical protein [Caudoviricetes sp.]